MPHRPQDIDGECNAWCSIGDDFGDNSCTFRCERPTEHEGMHMESFGDPGDSKCFWWERDQRPEMEAEDETMRGYEDGHRGVPEEHGEAYLAAFCVGVEEWAELDD